MLRVATAHWRDGRWLEVQRRYLTRHAGDDVVVYADVEGIDTGDARHADHVQDLASSRSFENGIVAHTEKLNALAATICERADDRDLLLFLDGDAFPIASLQGLASAVRDGLPLAAVRRDENLGDPQPHPSFCLTTVRFWKDIGGDWSMGHTWRNTAGREVTDAGGNLLAALERAGVEWRPLLRTNRRNIHPLWFAVYGDVAYHHGAGFRGGLCRRDREEIGAVPWPPPDLPSDPPPSAAARARWWLAVRKWYLVDKLPVVRRERRALERNRRLSEEVFAALSADEDFYLRV